MKINSAFIWAIVTIALVAASFFLGSITKNSPSNKTTGNELEEKTEEIEILKQKIDQLTEELTSRGIFSYPQANVASQQQNSVATILITLNGNDPIQDLEVRRSLTYDYSGIAEAGASGSLPDGEIMDLGTLKAHNPAAFEVPITDEEAAIHLRFNSQNDQWDQYIRIKRSPAGELKAFWVITNRDSEVIDKHIDEEFPLDENGKVILWKDKRIAYSNIEMNSIFQL